MILKTRTEIKSVLFVCRMNLCRSPFAEAAFRKTLKLWNLNSGITAASAGTYAGNGSPVPEAIDHLARDFDVDLSPFRSRELTKSLIKSADLIIVMDRSLISEINSIAGYKVKKARLLTSFSPNADVKKDIEDPSQKNPDSTRTVFLLIEHCMTGLVDWLMSARIK